jgi:hypothetical protein
LLLRGGLGLNRRHAIVVNLRLLALSSKGWRPTLDRSRKTLRLRSPISKIVLSIVEDLSSLGGMLIGTSGIARHNGRVVEELQQATTMLGQNNLLLGTFDGGGELGSISLLELLSGLRILLVLFSKP